jgi:hypothetical protein
MRKCAVRKKEIISARSERKSVHPPVEAKKPSAVKNEGENGGRTAV